jgi:hypothetical protein
MPVPATDTADRGPVGSALVLAVRFVAYFAAVSVATFPLAIALAAIEYWWFSLVGAVNLAGPVVALDRDVDAGPLVTFAVVAVLAFVLANAVAEIRAFEGLLADSTVRTVGSVLVGYAIAAFAVHLDPGRRLRAFLDPERRGRRGE